MLCSRMFRPARLPPAIRPLCAMRTWCVENFEEFTVTRLAPATPPPPLDRLFAPGPPADSAEETDVEPAGPCVPRLLVTPVPPPILFCASRLPASVLLVPTPLPSILVPQQVFEPNVLFAPVLFI